MDALLMLVVSAIMPWMLELSKDWSWFPFMQRVSKFAPILNRVTPLVVSFLAAIGITVGFDAQTGVFMLSGLVTSEILRAAILSIVGMVTNQMSYHGLVKQ